MTNLRNIPLSRVVDMMAEGVFVVDADCRIVLWNRAMEEMTGWNAADMMGHQPCSEMVCAENEAAESVCALLQQVSDQPLVLHKECRLKTREGATIPVLQNARVLNGETGQPAGVIVTLTDLRTLRRLEQDLAAMRHDASPIRRVGRLIGASPVMLEVYERIRLAAEADVTVLIQGETGTGKELVAEAIHRMSARKGKPLVKVNCSALAENLLESELFGHVKGAFTGAVKDKIGRIEMACGGTLLLDEIGDVSPLIQLKLLRVLQEQEYERVGEARSCKADVRFIAATHRDLKERVTTGEFREDFYYRIHVFAVTMPPLREHREDIPLLCEAFMDKLNTHTGKQIARVSHDARHCLMDYCWPGNVRQLENALEHAYVTCQAHSIELDDLPPEIRSAKQRSVECSGSRTQAALPVRGPTPALSRELLLDVLQACDWNQSAAARRLGVDRTTVWRRMKQWNIGASGHLPINDK